MKKLFTLLMVLLASLTGFSQSTTIVISQAYGGGGGSTGTYLFDYVELHNVSGTTQSLTGFSLQYGSATGQFASTATNLYAFPAGASIPAGGYLLIQLGPTGTGGAALPVTPDFITGNLAMSGTSGKVVLANQATALGCGATATPCTLPNPAIVDLVAWGTANNAEGGVSVNNGVAITSTQGCVRKTLGCTDTDNNNSDFDVITAPVPRNGASAVNPCGPPVPTLSASTLTSFGNVCINTTAGPNSFTITGTTLTSANVTVAALTGFSYATAAGGPYTASLSLPQPGGSFSQQVFVQFNPTLVQSYNGNIVVGGGGAPSINVAAVGSGINPAPIVTTGG
ncbi:MAG TPA: lamin tail domain-containing protein, partial [Ferruginibacter sp.]|nr:lamin tail domain-containing protein [Ferruginibacter sp.]